MEGSIIYRAVKLQQTYLTADKLNLKMNLEKFVKKSQKRFLFILLLLLLNQYIYN